MDLSHVEIVRDMTKTSLESIDEHCLIIYSGLFQVIYHFFFFLGLYSFYNFVVYISMVPQNCRTVAFDIVNC